MRGMGARQVLRGWPRIQVLKMPARRVPSSPIGITYLEGHSPAAFLLNSPVDRGDFEAVAEGG